MPRRLSPLLVALLFFAAMVAASFFGPPVRTLGHNVRLVYLHGALVWTALICYAASAGLGTLGLAIRKSRFHRWSLASGRTATVLWILYLPLSLWTMQANWNGLYLSEPRWRIAMDFTILALLVQSAILLIGKPALGSSLNLAFFAALVWSLAGADQVMHPRSPIFSSRSLAIGGFFAILVVMGLLASWQLTRWFSSYAR